MKTIAFYGTCSARAEKVLVSERVGYAYELLRILLTFPLGCQNLLLLRVYVSPDDHAPSSGAPSGISVFSENGQVDYVVGDGTQKDLEHSVIVAEAGSYIKVYADNDDYYDHAVDVQVMVEPA